MLLMYWSYFDIIHSWVNRRTSVGEYHSTQIASSQLEGDKRFNQNLVDLGSLICKSPIWMSGYNFGKKKGKEITNNIKFSQLRMQRNSIHTILK